MTGRVIYERSTSDPVTAAKARCTWNCRWAARDAVAGVRPKNGAIADDGTFTMKGGYGRCSSAFSARLAVKSVTLNGVDITDVPYDASRGNIKDLEIVMTDKRQQLLGQ